MEKGMILVAKLYLRQLWSLEISMKSSATRLKKARDDAYNITSTISDMPSSHSAVGADEKIINILSMETEWSENQKKYYDQKRHFSSLLQNLHHPLYATLLEMRYLSHMSWKQIENVLRYSHSHAMRLHETALKEFGQIIKDGTQ